MATVTDQLEADIEAGTERDKSIESLREILAREQLEPVSYEEAKELGYELMTFFEVFDAPGKKEESSGSPQHAA